MTATSLPPEPFIALSTEESFAYLESGRHGQMRLGLERMRPFLSHLGSPETRTPAIHIAGTNGKGSTTAFTAAMLSAAGLRVGMFCSPYVDRFGERIRILPPGVHGDQWWEHPDLGEITRDEAAKYINRIRRVIHDGALEPELHPTHFEMLTMMAFMHFADHACDVCVIETGLGGRLDSTNCIPHPLTTLITALGYDHQHILGDTLAEITFEKAGIIKPGIPCVVQDPHSSDHTPAEVTDIVRVLEEVASAQQAPLTRIDADQVIDLGIHAGTRQFTLAPYKEPFATRLLPRYQQCNAALAITAVEPVLQQTFSLTTEACHAALHQGIRVAYLPARFERIHTDPVIIRDGGHNPQGAEVLADSLDALYPDRPIHLVVAVMADKDTDTMFRIIAERLGHRIRRIDCVAPDVPRAMAPDMIQSALYGILSATVTRPPLIRSQDDLNSVIARAIGEAHTDGAAIICWGSLYQAGHTLQAVQHVTGGANLVSRKDCP